MSNAPGKISLNQSTAMSLNDRFSKYANLRRTQAPNVAAKPQQTTNLNKNNINNRNKINNNFMQKRASAKNRRLALQMANRPSVQAALKIKKKSIKQRLGAASKPITTTTIAPKLTVNTAKGVLRQRVGAVGVIKRRANIHTRLNAVRRGGKRGALTNRGLKARLGNIMNNNNKSTTISANTSQSGLNTSLTRKQNAIVAASNATTQFYNRVNRRPGRVNNSNNNYNTNNNNRNMQNNRRGNNRRGRGAMRGGLKRPQQQRQQQAKSKESLDTDLDQYMAKSKSHLNADLDQYMTQAH